MDTLHLKAPGCWINDPNGFIYFKGKYHMFYQCFPYATRWGTMHWGHAVSDDLIHWEHLGVAVFPTKHYDQNGIFSGGALEVDGKMNLYYSGIKYHACENDNCHIPLSDIYDSCQAMITSEDGFTFDNYDGKKMIVPVIHDDEIANYNHTRDPKVWKENDQYYMLLGSTYKKEIGRLLVLKSQDSVDWSIETILEDEKFGKILECPDMFEVNGQRILLASPMYILPKSEGYEAQAMVGTCDFDQDTCKVSNLGEFTFIDYGRDFYATQTCLDKEGRRVMMGWIRMPETVDNPWDKKPWNGMMSSPRVVEYRDNWVYFSIHPNVRKLFDKELTKEEVSKFDACGKNAYFIETKVSDGDAIDIGGYKIWMEDGILRTDRSKVFPENTDLKTEFCVPYQGKEYELSIIVDSNLVEIFVDGGKYVLSNCVYHLQSQLDGKIDKVYIASENE